MANNLLPYDAEEICMQVLQAIGHSSPPTDLDAICSLWPDLKVEEEDLDKEGYLIPFGINGAVIIVRRKDPPARKKFTLAHELGHWTQAHLTAGQVNFGRAEKPILSFQVHHNRHTLEEAWCNKFAACLLMPRRDICVYLKRQGKTNLAGRIYNGHKVFQVSSEAFLKRISDVTPISIFEVTCADERPRIRRKFLTKCRQDNLAEETMTTIANRIGNLEKLSEGVTLNDQCVHAQLTHSSRYSRSWLVSVTPVLRN